MALKKIINTEYGIPAGYWRIENIQINKYLNKGVNIELFLYFDSGASKAITSHLVNLSKVVDDKVVFDEDTYNKYFIDTEKKYADIYEACYMCAKETDDFFKDAVDC